MNTKANPEIGKGGSTIRDFRRGRPPHVSSGPEGRRPPEASSFYIISIVTILVLEIRRVAVNALWHCGSILWPCRGKGTCHQHKLWDRVSDAIFELPATGLGLSMVESPMVEQADKEQLVDLNGPAFGIIHPVNPFRTRSPCRGLQDKAGASILGSQIQVGLFERRYY